MRRLAAVAVALSLLFAAEASAQATPSLHVPVTPCRVLQPVTLSAGPTTYIQVRGQCNVPDSATAVVLLTRASGQGAAGALKVWNSGTFPPQDGQATYQASGSYTTLVDVGLCHPVLECAGSDVAVSASSAVELSITVEGYFAPPPE